MKRYLNIFFIGFLLILSSCDDNFDEINTDPNRAGADIFDPNLILPNVLAGYANTTVGYSGSILFQSMWTQTLASTTTGGANYYSNGDKYVASGSINSYIQNVWNSDFANASRADQMEKLSSENPDLVNLQALGKMMKVLNLSFITDIYGDIPYSEALMAEEGITQPVYDKQEVLYPAMLQDLESALNAMDASQRSPTNDPLYAGDISKWRKFGYSLMLKLAMRMVNSNPTEAQSYLAKALAGGIFASTADEAVLPMDADNFPNTNANSLRTVDDTYEVRWSKPLIDYLVANDDPRLSISAEVPPAGLAANFDPNSVGNSDPAIQIGLPNGYDTSGGATDISNHPDFPGPSGTGDDEAKIGNYSRPTGIYRERSAPIFILTYGEIQLLLADAAARGYTTPGSAAQHYSNGIVGVMLSMNSFGSATQLTEADALAFAAANPLDVSSTEASLQMINEQIWASTGLMGNFVETWNNWKRTGYPVLTPVNFSGNFSNGQIPLRQVYPSSESSNNPDNFNAAVSNMGGDTWTTKMWWAK
ncbi:Starch-binding associating with outer membrane [Arenibacter palladensis]|uniref:Starch-binding associating with outer membrane n=1 Tax=Arenibacter palladensis TaxID=237373 RepID=A0A1M4XF70_9FLAO|nr:SusD/RagB family nutrient-binding outer membrane lipoprotein [Arenibacter palladensis]SHE92257.1 Starch-binding associating with outer membrane [Arenibacter palladensis]